MCACELIVFLGRLKPLFLFIAIVVMANLTIYASFAHVTFAQVPLEGQSEVIEKSLRQSFPQEFPSEPKAPKVTNKTGPTRNANARASYNFFLKKIKITGNSVISDKRLMSLVDLGEGRDFNLSMLNDMADEISAFYASEGYLLARAFIPKQEIKDNTAVITIFEGRINKIVVRNNKKLSKKSIAKKFRVVQNQLAIKEKTLERVLLELNEIMGIEVTTVLRRGELPGASDLVLNVTESKPYTVSFDSDNFGSRYTGPDRYGLSMTYANIFTLGDQFAGRWARSEFGQDSLWTSSKFGQYSFTSLYTFPINAYGTRMKLNHTFSENELGGSLKSLAAGGTFTAYGLEVSQLVHKSRTASFSARTRLDVKHIENEAQGINTSKDNLMNVSLGFAGNLSDSFLGRTFYDLNLEMGLRERDTNRALVSRKGGHGEIFTTQIKLTRLQSAKILNSYFTLKFEGQYNTERALSSYLFGIGGMGSVRGYPLSAFQGDYGYNVSAEYTLPFPWHVSFGHSSIPELSKILSFTSFVDHGQTYVRAKQPGEIDQHITSAGGGLKLTLPKIEGKRPTFRFAATYGIPVFNSIAPADGSSGTIYLNGRVEY
jgi:hemolysin activation/secretion protein